MFGLRFLLLLLFEWRKTLRLSDLIDQLSEGLSEILSLSLTLDNDLPCSLLRDELEAVTHLVVFVLRSCRDHVRHTRHVNMTLECRTRVVGVVVQSEGVSWRRLDPSLLPRFVTASLLRDPSSNGWNSFIVVVTHYFCI